MTHPDKFPPTLLNKQFPIGDIGAREEQKAQKWLAELKTRTIDTELGEDRDDVSDKLIHDINMANRFSQVLVGEKTNKAAMALCNSWDVKVSDDHPYKRSAILGYGMARLLVCKTHVMPVDYIDYSTELTRMAFMDESGPEALANSAWSCMQRSHKKLYDIHNKLKDIGLEMFDVNTPDRYDRFRAGMIIPYLTAAATRLENYSSQITGVRAEPITDDNFLASFVKTGSFAHDEPKRRL